MVDKEVPVMLEEVDELSVNDLGRAQRKDLKTLLGTKRLADEDEDDEENKSNGDNRADDSNVSNTLLDYGKIDMKVSVSRKFDIK